MPLAADLCGEHFSLVDNRDSTGTPLHTCRAHRDICSLVGFFLDQHHPGAFGADPFSLTCLASLIFPVVPTFPAFHIRSVLLGRIVEELNGRQTGGVLQMALFFEEAIPVHRGNAALDSWVAVLLAASVPPCKQIQQVFRVVPLVDALSQCLLLAVLGVSLRLLTGWNSAGHSAVGEFHETPEQAVMLFPSPWQPQFDAGGHQLVGLSSPASAFPSLVVAKGQFVRCHYVLTLGCSSLLAWLP